ncbi:MAG: gliding motility-associated C-terminal domain-containing protein [Flavobacteriales bacterium]|nr:gliding motility-associated C-terminal domain-containing protein [Flavobacteriales bacterium]
MFKPVIIGYAKETYELNIFDRWGTTVFSSKDASIAWNGAKNNSGAVLPQAVYVWRVTARDQFTTDQREWFGTVTLVK